jgi:single-strand DNA-binding protein
MIVMTVSGNLGKDAELKRTPSGDEVLSFSIASNGKVKGEKVTTWVTCTVWGKRGAALAPYLTKGTRVVAVGEGHVRLYQSQGETKASVECRVDQLDILGGGAREDAPRAPVPARAPVQHGFGQREDDDELPF